MIKDSSTSLPVPEDPPPSDRSLERDLRNLQVVLSVEGIREIALSSPLWALIMAFIFGGLLPELGERPAIESWPWITLCAVVGAGMFGLWLSVRRKASEKRNGRLQMWVVAFGCFSVGATWSFIVPLFWVAGNTLNHCFLLVVIIGSVSMARCLVRRLRRLVAVFRV